MRRAVWGRSDRAIDPTNSIRSILATAARFGDLRNIDNDALEPPRTFVSFSNRALECFHIGDARTKRLILGSVGSNLSLKDKMIIIEAKKPLRLKGGRALIRPHHVGGAAGSVHSRKRD